MTRRAQVGIVGVLLTALALAAPAVTGAPSDEVAGASAPIMSPAMDKPVPYVTGLPEEVGMVLVGTMLIGVAAAVRKAA